MKQSSLRHLIAAKGEKCDEGADDSNVYQICQLEAFKFKNSHFVAMDLIAACWSIKPAMTFIQRLIWLLQIKYRVND